MEIKLTNLLISLIVFVIQIFPTQADTKYLLQDVPIGKVNIEGSYIPRGSEYQIGNLTVYESHNRVPKRLLIAVHDSAGISANLQQIADIFSEIYNFRVVLPNFLRLGPDNPPPTDVKDIAGFLAKHGDWDTRVKCDILGIINWFKAKEYISEVGIYGMCWGGKIATLAASQVDDIRVAGVVHPVPLNTSDAFGVKAPMYLMPASNDVDLIPFFEILQKKFGDNCGHKRFNDMVHGFTGARANFSDPLIVKRVKEVITTLGPFFNGNVKNSSY